MANLKTTSETSVPQGLIFGPVFFKTYINDYNQKIKHSISFKYKQETDKLRDEDLYKFLAEIKRPSSAPKKLKCIPGTLKIEVCPCPDEIKNGLTPELAKLHPYGGKNYKLQR